jgi:hypothetical protein
VWSSKKILVMPAKAGIHLLARVMVHPSLDSRLRGNDSIEIG